MGDPTKLSDFAIGMRPVVAELIKVGMEENRNKDMVPLLAEVRQIEGNGYEVPIFGGFGALKRTYENAMFDSDRAKQLYSVVFRPVKYGLSCSVTSEAIEDNKAIDIVMAQTEGFGRAAIEARNISVHSIYNNAFNSSFVGADGKELCATNHPSSGGSNRSNRLSSDSSLTESTLENMVIEAAALKDDAGLILSLDLHTLLVPKELKFTAERILKNSTMRPGTADRDINALVSTGCYSKGIIVSQYLTSSTAIFALTSEKKNGVMFLERQELRLSDDVQFTTDNLMMKASARWAQGWGQPFGVFGNAGA